MTGTERILAGGPLAYPLRAHSSIGGEVYERELLRRLPEHGVDLALGLPHGHGYDVAPAGWRIHTLPDRSTAPWPAQALAFVPFVVALARREHVQLLRGHSIRLSGPALLAGRAVARTRRLPVVLHQHHLEPRWERLEAEIMARADAVITVSEHSRSALAALGVPPERVHVVPDGIDATAPVDPWRDAWPPGEGPRLLYVGRLEARKRPHVAVETAARVEGARLVVAGDGPLAAELIALARERGVAAAFRGRVSEAAKWRLYDGADVLLFPSTLEGFGIVVAEAQARGVPVVAAAGTGTDGTLRDGESGMLVPSEPGAFAAAAARLSDPALRERFSLAAREHARHFDWDVTAAAVAAIYHELVARA